MFSRFLLIAGLILSAGNACAAVEGRRVEYRDGDAVLEGYLASDGAHQGKRPGILVVHEWKGLNDYARHRADQLAQMGYVAFAADMYGKGIVAKDHQEAAQLSGLYRSDRQLMRRRVQAAFEVLKSQPAVDSERIGAIGYCFGGCAVLELARSGADVKGVVSFHGPLDTPDPVSSRPSAEILVLTGADDPHIRLDQIAAFEKEMKAAGAGYRVIVYPGAVHSFTVPEAGNDPSKGMAYNAEADRKSWQKMKEFFARIFAESVRSDSPKDFLGPLSRELDATLKETTRK